MAKAKDTSAKCGKYDHKWDCGVCTVCFEEHPTAKRQRVWNAMMARIVAAGADSYGAVPPPPDYSTPRAVSDRALERGTRDPWYLHVVSLARQEGRTYRAFARAVERAGGTLALPFPEGMAVNATTAPGAGSLAPRRAVRRPRAVLAERIAA